MQVKTSELTGAVLDWTVASCLGAIHESGFWDEIESSYYSRPASYSTDWSQGGPIIEREGIGFFCNHTSVMGARFRPDAGADWRAFALNKHGTHYYGPTPLIAAMRCYCCSKLGDIVDVPEELVKGTNNAL